VLFTFREQRLAGSYPWTKNPPQRIRHRGHDRWIPTTDQERALRFYTEKLGFAVATDQPFNEKQRWIEMRIANAATRVVLFTPEGHEDRVGTFFNGSSACDNAQATYRQLKERGVEFVSEPRHHLNAGNDGQR
jgi:catechol 2,3-dioxygenase-like lactoylglutathione lyase family enzyme